MQDILRGAARTHDHARVGWPVRVVLDRPEPDSGRGLTAECALDAVVACQLFGIGTKQRVGPCQSARRHITEILPLLLTLLQRTKPVAPFADGLRRCVRGAYALHAPYIALHAVALDQTKCIVGKRFVALHHLRTLGITARARGKCAVALVGKRVIAVQRIACLALDKAC